MTARAALLLLTAVLGSGCGSAAAPDDPAGGTARPAPTTAAEAHVPPDDPTPDPASAAAAPASPAEVAVHDLAQRRSVPAERITVVRVAEVTWPDGSLGCPRPGMSYTQALVPGLLVVLALDGATYEYHSDGRRAPFLCERPQPPVDGGR